MTTPRSTPTIVECSLGDPCGIGPEVLAQVLSERREGLVRVHGHRELLLDAAPGAGVRADLEATEGVSWTAVPLAHRPEGAPPLGDYTRAWGAYALASLQAALASSLDLGRALVTCPLSKNSFIEGGAGAVGHTEFLARAAGVPEDDVLMLFDGGDLRIATLTRHIPLAAVPGQVKPSSVVRAAALVANYLRPLGFDAPRIALACLDPHCGEWGGLADTDLDLRTALAETGARIYGPLAADTLFLPSNLSRFDAVLCWYHDQAMIPVKMAAFDVAVNISLGLPFLRTSPAHGPGYDIAGQGIADVGSMARAMDLALRAAPVAH